MNHYLMRKKIFLRIFVISICFSSFPLFSDNLSKVDSEKLKINLVKIINESKIFKGSEKQKFKNFGLMPKCQKGFKFEIGLCYRPCKKGFKGAGPLCWKQCKKGFRDLGLSCHKKGSFKTFYKKKKEKRQKELPIYLGINRPKKIKYIRDQKGRALILRGINSSNTSKKNPKYLPWITKKSVIQETRDFGFNGVRFLIFWAGIEPKRGVYNDKYLDQVAKRVKWYTDNGAYVFLDMHQDIYGYGVRGGNGAPKWATETGIASKYKN